MTVNLQGARTLMMKVRSDSDSDSDSDRINSFGLPGPSLHSIGIDRITGTFNLQALAG